MPASHENHTVRALTYGGVAIALLCAMDGVIKHLVATNDALVVTLGRYVFGAMFALVIWQRSGSPSLTREMWKAHAVRGVVIAISASLFFWCVSVLPLAELITICFVAPLLIPFVARAVLAEKIRPRSIIAGLVGFAGVVVASVGTRFDAMDPERLLGVAGAIGSAVTYALSITLLRGRAGKDGAAVVGVLSSVIPGAIIALPTALTGDLPPASDLPAFLALGAFAAAGMWFFARAYANAEAQVLAPLEYTALIWAAIIGYAFFAEVPHPQVWAGAVVIIGACLWGAHEPKREKQDQPAPAGSL
jgi:S-adenosylmethionine uptake transporter